MSAKLSSREQRRRRQLRVRGKVRGTAQRPRLSVYKSLNHIYAQVIDDEAGHTLAAARGISMVVFDRGGWPYWGKLQSLADAAREHGLEF